MISFKSFFFYLFIYYHYLFIYKNEPKNLEFYGEGNVAFKVTKAMFFPRFNLLFDIVFVPREPEIEVQQNHVLSVPRREENKF